MSYKTEKSPHSSTDQRFGRPPIAAPPAEESTTPSIASDRLYQFAAFTAGLFLLVTLL